MTLYSNSPLLYQEFVKDFGSITNSFIFTAGWSRDTRDSILFPTRGMLQSLAGEIGVGDLLYYKTDYLIQWFTPMPYGSVLMLRTDLGYGGGLGNKPLPFFKAYYAGGVGSVRGYQTASSGPQDIAGNTIGGRQKIVGNVELFFPVPGTRPGTSRCACRCSPMPGRSTIVALSRASSRFGFSTGVGLAWNSPVGPLKSSYGYPLNPGPHDRIQRFQFQVGTVF